MMAHGAPDDSNVKMGVDVTRIDDLAELAVRLGSIVTYNRGGNVLIMDGFDSGMNGWGMNVPAGDGSIAVSPDETFMGEVACKMESGTGVFPHCELYKYLPPITDCGLGLQMAFFLNSDVVKIEFILAHVSAGRSYAYLVYYDHTIGQLYLTDPVEGAVLIGTPEPLYDGDKNYHNMKLVIDMESRKYLRFYLDNTVYDISGYNPTSVPWLVGPTIRPSVSLYGDGGTSAIIYLDNMIVTYNEF